MTQEWLDIKQKTCKESTVKEYERMSKGNLMPAFGDKPIAELTRQTLQKYLFGFIEEGNIARQKNCIRYFAVSLIWRARTYISLRR